MRKCSLCKKAKQLYSNGVCRPCNVAKTVAWRKANPDRAKEHKQRHHRKIRNAAIGLLGGKCKRCGMADPRCLQIDHISGGGSKERKAIGHRGMCNKIIEGKAAEYQLLCSNCNWIKRFELGETA